MKLMAFFIAFFASLLVFAQDVSDQDMAKFLEPSAQSNTPNSNRVVSSPAISGILEAFRNSGNRSCEIESLHGHVLVLFDSPMNEGYRFSIQVFCKALPIAEHISPATTYTVRGFLPGHSEDPSDVGFVGMDSQMGIADRDQ